MQQNYSIPDELIPTTALDSVVQQYEPLIFKIANRYKSILDRTGTMDLEDLHQAGRIAVMDAQKTYDPGGGMSFIGWLTLYVKKAMRKTLGINPHTGEAPAPMVYLDEPIPGFEDEELTRLDVLADPDAVPFDETIIEDETRRETSEQVRAALDRLKSEKQREVITRVYLEGQERSSAAAAMEIKTETLYRLDKEGRARLRRDWRLKKFAATVPFVHVGVSRFNTTWTSATEYAALWRLEHQPESSPEPVSQESTADRIREIWSQEHRQPRP